MKVLVLLFCCAVFVAADGDIDSRCPKVDTTTTYLPDEKECAVFYECSNGRSYKFTCNTGTYWDQKLETCAYNVDCGDLSTTTSEPTTTTSD